MSFVKGLCARGFVADFSGRRSGRPSGQTRVRLARGRTGWFTPRSCGGPCAPPMIEWRERRTAFSIQANIPALTGAG